ncbi:MAG: hypothetical protein Q7O66_23070 [Dehalococcoidia bacterium]|nr:hypothetical protein [Dehalococcoidia bacterium]
MLNRRLDKLESFNRRTSGQPEREDGEHLTPEEVEEAQAMSEAGGASFDGERWDLSGLSDEQLDRLGQIARNAERRREAATKAGIDVYRLGDEQRLRLWETFDRTGRLDAGEGHRGHTGGER